MNECSHKYDVLGVLEVIMKERVYINMQKEQSMSDIKIHTGMDQSLETKMNILVDGISTCLTRMTGPVVDDD